MDRICCVDCSCSCNSNCNQKCNCVQKTVKTQIILYVQQKQKRTEIKRQLANKPKHINIKPSMGRQNHIKEAQIKKLENSTSKISRRSVDLQQTRNQFNNSASVLSKNTENWNPNDSYGYHKSSYKTPKTKLKNNSMIMAPNLSEQLQLRLIDQDNQNLKRQLKRLKREQKQLLTAQRQMKNKFCYEIGYLKSSSEDIKQRSIQRRKQIKELQEMLECRRQSKGDRKRFDNNK